MEVEPETVIKEHGQDQGDEEEMDDHGGKDFDDWQDANAESHFLDDEGVLGNGAGAVVDAVAKEKPGEHAADQPENVGVTGHRLRVEANLEDKPEYAGHGQRKKEGPDDAEIRSQITGGEVPFGQLEYDFLFFGKFPDKEEKHSDAVHAVKTSESGTWERVARDYQMYS